MQDESRMSPWVMFNMEVPEDHMPAKGVHPRAAKAIVSSEAWTDARPEMNLSSFVTTFREPEEVELAREHMRSAPASRSRCTSTGRRAGS